MNLGEAAQDPVAEVDLDCGSVKHSLVIMAPGIPICYHAFRRYLEYLGPSVEVAAMCPAEERENSAWVAELIPADCFLTYGETDSVNEYNAQGCGTMTAAGEEQITSAMATLRQWEAQREGRRIGGIACSDDFGLQLQTELCNRLGVPGTHPDLMRVVRDKLYFREACDLAGIYTVQRADVTDEFVTAVSSGNTMFPFPAIMKPRSGAGSFHISRLESAADFREAWDHIQDAYSTATDLDKALFEGGFVLEEFFVGQEIDVDGWAWQGNCEFMMVNDNNPPIPPDMSEIGGTYPSWALSPELQTAAQVLCQSVITAVADYTRNRLISTTGSAPDNVHVHSPFHFEALVNLTTGRCMPIELNARWGGAETPTGIECVSGYWMPGVCLDCALGLPVKAPGSGALSCAPHHPVGWGLPVPFYPYVTTVNVHSNVGGVMTACSGDEIDVDGVNLIGKIVKTMKVGHEYIPGGGRYGMIAWLATAGNTQEEALTNMKTALEQMVVEMDGVRLTGKAMGEICMLDLHDHAYGLDERQTNQYNVFWGPFEGAMATRSSYPPWQRACQLDGSRSPPLPFRQPSSALAPEI